MARKRVALQYALVDRAWQKGRRPIPSYGVQGLSLRGATARIGAHQVTAALLYPCA